MAVLRKLLREKDLGAKDRNSIAQALGHSSGSSGVAGRKISALIQFGLYERRDDSFRPTKLGRLLAEEDSREGFQRAFLSPPLFQEIVDKYRPDGAVPHYFAQALPGYGVTETAKYEVARIFMASAEYAGILAADGVFRDEDSESAEPAQPPVQEKAQAGEILPLSPETAPALSSGADSEIQTFRFFLTDRKPAELKLPAGLNEADIAMLKKFVEFMEFQIQTSRPAAPLPFRRTGKSGESA